MSAAISPSSRRNSCGCVLLSRNRVRLCCTSGCAMTVTPFISIFRDLPQEIHAAFAQLGDVEAQVELDVMRRAALAEHGEKIRDVVVLAVFDQVGIAED